jgi:hypothetical protein
MSGSAFASHVSVTLAGDAPGLEQAKISIRRKTNGRQRNQRIW